MSRIGIVGGGIVGLCTAYYLRRAGHEVVILDQTSLEDGCSFGNAGMIVPSHFVPLAAPGMVAKGIRWMFDSGSPFYVRPRWSKTLFDWGLKFYRHANARHVRQSMPALSALSHFSQREYRHLASSLPFAFGYEERGLLMLYHDRSVEKEEVETAHLASTLGIDARVLSLQEIQKLETDVRVNALGGVYYPGDSHLVPGQFVRQLIELLNHDGVQIERSTQVVRATIENKEIRSVITSRGEFEADRWVLAAGSWSGELGAFFGLNLPLQAGKGYSFTLKNVTKNTRIPTIFLEPRVAVTPMGKDLRFGGTMEITGLDHSINMNRVRGIVNAIGRYYPEMMVDLPAKEEVWHGLRPCSPDGLPYIGRTRQCRNLLIATGHAMMGLSLGPGTGKIVCELIEEKTPEVDLTLFDPDRFSQRLRK